MRALVTGGNRYIGLHLLHELVGRGHDVTVVNSHAADIPSEVRRIHCDRRIPGALTEALTPHRDDFDIV
jgi:nucleoside-diphosphate-sugar epimerase